MKMKMTKDGANKLLTNDIAHASTEPFDTEMQTRNFSDI